MITLDPDNAALYGNQQQHWSSRAHYHSYGKVIDGIPISKINKKWCAANLLNKADFPAEAGMAEFSAGVELYAENLKVGQFKNVKASVGIARNCSDDDTHLFILFTARSGKKHKVLYLEEFENRYLKDGIDEMFISRVNSERLIIWWCSGCDVYNYLDWSNNKFEWLPSEEMGE